MDKPAAWWTLVLVALALSACGGQPRNEVVLVMAASSLTDAFSEMETAFEAAHPELDLQLNLAGSSSLREQILQGAPADVFASANTATMQAVVDPGFAHLPETFARNSLVIAVPADNPAGVTGIADLANPDLLVGLCAEQVPCGEFARLALEQAGVAASIDTNESDVRSLVTKLKTGELDAGIVYATDVTLSGELVGIELPPTTSVDIVYPIADLTDAENAEGARVFVEFVLSAEGQAILQTHGFMAP